jgi:hypothetical protein
MGRGRKEVGAVRTCRQLLEGRGKGERRVIWMRMRRRFVERSVGVRGRRARVTAERARVTRKRARMREKRVMVTGKRAVMQMRMKRRLLVRRAKKRMNGRLFPRIRSVNTGVVLM